VARRRSAEPFRRFDSAPRPQFPDVGWTVFEFSLLAEVADYPRVALMPPIGKASADSDAREVAPAPRLPPGLTPQTPGDTRRPSRVSSSRPASYKVESLVRSILWQAEILIEGTMKKLLTSLRHSFTKEQMTLDAQKFALMCTRCTCGVCVSSGGVRI
jgi:hypothetical protein